MQPSVSSMDFQIMSVGTTIDPTFDITRDAVPAVRFPAVEGVAPPILSPYDIASDGRRFMAIRQGVPSAGPTWTRGPFEVTAQIGGGMGGCSAIVWRRRCWCP